MPLPGRACASVPLCVDLARLQSIARRSMVRVVWLCLPAGARALSDIGWYRTRGSRKRRAWVEKPRSQEQQTRGPSNYVLGVRS